MTAAICKKASQGKDWASGSAYVLQAGFRKVVFRDSATNRVVVLCSGIAYYADVARIDGPSTVVTASLPDIFDDRRGGSVLTMQLSTFAPVELQNIQKEVLYA